jgi:diguanylate cyclase (GGDEF)-like protein
MIEPRDPPDEGARLAALHSLGLLDTPPEERFDRYTRLARRLFGVNMVLVSLVDSDRQWFKSKDGLDAAQTPRAISFCGHAIHLDDEPLVVVNALDDERFHDNPLVSGPPNIRFYAGHPLRVHSHNVGTFCLISEEPRQLDAEERALLADLAGLVVDELAATMSATSDPLTGLTNRRGFDAICEHALATCRRMERPASLLFFDLDGFKALNDTFGHDAGDEALVQMARHLRDSFRASDVVARRGGDEFCVLCTGATRDQALPAVQRLRQLVDAANEARGSWKLDFSVGAIEYDPHRHGGLADLVREADEQMYEAKRQRKAAR